MKLKYIVILFISFLALDSFSQEKLSLSEAIKRGLENNYKIRIEKNTVKTSEINNSWGNAGAFPRLSLSLSDNFMKQSGDAQLDQSNNLGATISLTDITIFKGFSVRISKNRLQELENLSKGNYAVLIENTIENIMLAYYNVILEKERLASSEYVLKLSKDRYNREKKKFDKGNKTSYELLQSKIAWLEDKTDFLNKELIYKNSIRDLNYVIGEKKDKTYEFTDELNFEYKDYVLVDMINKLESNNKTIKNQYINLTISKNAIKQAKSNYYPSLTSSLSYGLKNDNIIPVNSNTTNKSNYNTLSASLNLNYSIYTGGTRKRALDIAKINQDVSQIELENKKHSLRNELLKIYQKHILNKQMLDLSIEQLDAAEHNLSLSTKKFKLGAINSFNYRDVQSVYNNSRIKNSQSKYNLIQSWIKLLKITGGLSYQSK